MDEQTLGFYRDNSPEIFNRFDGVRGGVSEYSDIAFSSKSTVLDIGCGSAWVVRLMLEKGIDAYGCDPCRDFLDSAVTKYPQLDGRLFESAIPGNMEALTGRQFDGILCSAVLMHIPEEDLFDAVYAIRNLLKDKGRLLLSLPSTRDDISGDRDKHGRLMIIRNPWDIHLLLERIGFQLLDHWESEDALGRKGIQWTTMLFSFRQENSLRPIDKIEGVLNRDRKDATYKLALFRAICDIALTEYKRVKWEKGNKISILLNDIVDKWLIYYWPLVENSVPQKFGEYPSFKRKMAFRLSMNQLVEHYQGKGGLSAFIIDSRSLKLNDREKKLFGKVVSDIRQTIIKGPIVYAGGSLQTGKVFEYDAKTKRVVFSWDLWREFVLMGHWIRDALILRWAELTSRIAGDSVRPSAIIDLLLQNPIPERETGDARKVYKEIKSKECVWSGKTLRDDFHVDHAIPYSLWMNNDLWNLFPIAPAVNNGKRDKLPTSGLVKRRKDLIVDYWKLLRGRMSNRFDYEMLRFTGLDNRNAIGWENRLFSHFIEAIEYTAIQRGWERWEP